MYTALLRVLDVTRSQLRHSVRLVKEYSLAAGTVVFPTRYRHWNGVAKGGVPSWDIRNEMIAAAIPANSSVVDLGCGAQTLRTHLKPGCTYRPFDFIKGSPSVEFCDINAGVYPKIGTPVDYIVCSGLLEYLQNPRLFLSKIAPMSLHICLSYNVVIPGETRRRRLACLWVNHMTQTEIERIFTDLRFSWRLINARCLTGTGMPSELIYMLEQSGGG